MKQNFKPVRGYAIVETRMLGGDLVREGRIDPTDLYATQKAAHKELSQFGMPQDFAIIPVLIQPLSPKKPKARKKT